MPFWLGLDHRYIVLGAFGATAAVAVYSTYKLRSERRRRHEKNVYESEKLLNEYLVFHYGSPQEVLRYDFGLTASLDFPRRCAELCLKHSQNEKVPSRALDIGCAVGRSTFELAHRFKEVIGLDYSQAFVDTCNFLKENGSKYYFVQDEGDLVTNLTATVPENLIRVLTHQQTEKTQIRQLLQELSDMGLLCVPMEFDRSVYLVAISDDRTRATFIQGDACDLPQNLGTFGCVLAANLICRLHSPFLFLSRLAELVASGGILVITSPYTWLEEFTNKNTWLGGYKDKNGKDVTGFDTLKSILSTAFDLIEDKEMPFFIRETAHKNQWSVAHATVWRRI